jgi:hypothetical protein
MVPPISDLKKGFPCNAVLNVGRGQTGKVAGQECEKHED